MKIQFEKNSYLKIDSQPLAGTTFTNWIRILKENHFKISLQFLPKFLYISLIIAFLSPLRIKEKRFCKIHCKDIKISPPIFIIGHWRSGTTFLHYLMGRDSNLAYVSTIETLAPNIFLTNDSFLNNYMKNRLPKKRPMDNLEMRADFPYEDEYAIANNIPYSFYHGWYFPNNIMKYFYRYVLFNNVNQKIIENWASAYINFLKKISYKKPAKRILLKSLVNTAKIKFLLDLFPNAQFIHIYRNPYDVYKSTWKLYNSILPLFSFQHIKHDVLDDAILKIYTEIYNRYLAEKHLIPEGNLYEISYEAFIKDPLKNLKGIYDFFGLKGFDKAKPHFKKYIDFHNNYKNDRYDINKKDKEKVLRHWGFAFNEFGYSP